MKTREEAKIVLFMGVFLVMASLAQCLAHRRR